MQNVDAANETTDLALYKGTLSRIRSAYVEYRTAESKLTVVWSFVRDSDGVDLSQSEIQERFRHALTRSENALADLCRVVGDETSIFRDDGFPSRLQSMEEGFREQVELRCKAEQERDDLRAVLAKLQP